MATFAGPLRSQIPWAPQVDSETCNGCKACLDQCPHGVYALDEGAGVMRVAAPDNCVVLCDRCAALCPSHSISFPSKEATRRLLRDLVVHARPEGSAKKPQEPP